MTRHSRRGRWHGDCDRGSSLRLEKLMMYAHRPGAYTARDIRLFVPKRPLALPVILAIVGALGGAVIGIWLGPLGALVGAAAVALIGVVVGLVLHSEQLAEARYDSQLDEEIGVFGGSVGEASAPSQPSHVPHIPMTIAQGSGSVQTSPLSRFRGGVGQHA